MSRFLWTQKEDIGPSARFGHAMSYDSVRSRTVLFGGSSLIGGQVGSVNDTWEWDGEFWTQMADIGPAARQDHAMCFDSVRQTTLLFGGLSGQNTPLGDTWSWNGEDWTQLDDSGPSARSGHAMVFDSARGHAVLLVGSRQLVSSTTPGSGTAWPGPNSKTQVHRLDGITRWPSTWCTTSSSCLAAIPAMEMRLATPGRGTAPPGRRLLPSALTLALTRPWSRPTCK